jgi:Matrixin
MIYKIKQIYHRNLGTSFSSYAFSMIFLFILCGITYSQTNQYVDTQNTIPLRWKSNKIKIALSNSLYNQSQYPNVDLVGAVKRSLRAWETVANIEFVETKTDKLSSSWKGKSGDGINLISIAPVAENLAFFEEANSDISANTRVYFNRKGTISEADIILNPFVQFSTDGTYGTFDIESTITHEIGHLLGLDHSIIIGSSMQTHQGRNGIYSFIEKISRNISSDTIVGIRSLYGEQLMNEKCCGVLSGKINAKSFSENTQIWVENSEDGVIAAGFKLRQDGNFKFTSFPIGKYRIFAADENELASSQLLGDVLVKRNAVVQFVKTVNMKPKVLSVLYVGLNSQLSNIAVTVGTNSQNTVYIGGKHLIPSDVKIILNSPELSVKTGTMIAHEFSDELSVISFELVVSETASVGNYSINLQNSAGETSSLIGGIQVSDKK